MNLPEPIFIVALPKSYTSVFSAMLGQHSALCTVPELNLFTGRTVLDWATQPSYQGLCDGLLRTVAQYQFGGQTVETVDQALEWLRVRAPRPVIEIFDHLRTLVAPAALIDQSPAYAQNPAMIQGILSAYPKARFIHMTRNPQSWVQSIAKWGPVGKVLLYMYSRADRGMAGQTDPLNLWHAAHFGLGDLLGSLGPDRYIRIMGEDVVARTDATLTRVLDWLGLPFDAAVLAQMRATSNSVFAGYGPPNARLGNNPDFLASPALRTRTDREALVRIDLTAAPVPDDVLRYARSIGYA